MSVSVSASVRELMTSSVLSLKADLPIENASSSFEQPSAWNVLCDAAHHLVQTQVTCIEGTARTSVQASPEIDGLQSMMVVCNAPSIASCLVVIGREVQDPGRLTQRSQRRRGKVPVS